MTTVNVKGVGDIDLPDDLTQDQMQEALDSHPDVQAYVAKQNPTTLGGKIDKGLTNVFGPINDYIKKNNFLGMETSKNVAHEATKGIPILGAMVPEDTDENKQFQSDHPIASKAIPFAAGTAATAPLLAAVGGASALKPVYNLTSQYGPKAFNAAQSVGSKGLNFISQTLGQAGAGGAINAADAAAHGKDSSEITREAKLGAGFGGLGPLFGKLLSPGLKISENMGRTLAGVAGAVGGGLNSIETGVLGLLLGELPHGARLAQRAVGNKVFDSPTNQALLNALTQQSSRSTPDNMFGGPTQ